MRKLVIIALLCSAIAAQRQVNFVSQLEDNIERTDVEQAGKGPSAEYQAMAATTVSTRASDGLPAGPVAATERTDGNQAAVNPTALPPGAAARMPSAPPVDGYSIEREIAVGPTDTRYNADGLLAETYHSASFTGAEQKSDDPNTEPVDAEQVADDPNTLPVDAGQAADDPNTESTDAGQKSDDPNTAPVDAGQAADDPNTESTDAGQKSDDPNAAPLDAEQAAHNPNAESTDAGQQSDDPFADLGGDPFADLEADAAKEAAKKEAGPLGKLVENLSGKAYLQYTGYFNNRQKKRGSDNKNNFWDTALDLETWTSGKNWRVDASAWAQAGNQNKTFYGASPDDGGLWRDLEEQENRHFVLNEIYLTRNFGSWDLTLGKKIAKNGISTLYSPADVLRPVAGFDPLSVRDFGVWQAWADIYKGDYTWTLAVLPVYQPDKVPHTSSRWVNTAAGRTPPRFNYPDIDPKDYGWFARVKTVKNGWDLFASLYVGPGRQYVIKQIKPVPVTLERNVPYVVNPAVGYSTTHGRWEFHGEAVHTNSLRGEDQDYFTFVQGTTLTLDGDYVTYRGLEQILATVEVAWEARTGDQTASHFVTTSDSTRTGQSDLITRLQFKVNEDFSVEYSGHFIFKKWGYANRFGAKWKIMNNLTWNNGFEFFGGSKGQGPAAGLNNLAVNYGEWILNNRFISALEYKF